MHGWWWRRPSRLGSQCACSFSNHIVGVDEHYVDWLLVVELEERDVFHCAIFIKYEGDTTAFSSKILAQFVR